MFIFFVQSLKIYYTDSTEIVKLGRDLILKTLFTLILWGFCLVYGLY